MTGNPPARIDDLPASLIDVAEILGMRVALALISEFGGREVKFPAHPRPDHPVIKALGEKDGLAICSLLRGQQVYVPHARAASTRADIVSLEKRGLDRAAIARKLGISQRHVRRVANHHRSDPRQSGLFD